jgi:hypothetical protein
LLAPREFLADFGRQGVMLSALGEEPALMAVATTGDFTQALARAAGVFGRDQAQVGHELARVCEAVDVTQLTDGDHGRDHLKASRP